MTSSHVSWILPILFGVVSTISIGVNVIAWRMWARIDKQERKLVIHDATYGAIEGTGSITKLRTFLIRSQDRKRLSF